MGEDDSSQDGLGTIPYRTPEQTARRHAHVRSAASGPRARPGALCRRPPGDGDRRDASQAKDAAELVAIDYEPLPAVTDTAELPSAHAVWHDCPDNVSNLFEAGNQTATEAALANAAHIIRRRYVISRVFAHFMEPRGAIGS